MRLASGVMHGLRRMGRRGWRASLTTSGESADGRLFPGTGNRRLPVSSDGRAGRRAVTSRVVLLAVAVMSAAPASAVAQAHWTPLVRLDNDAYNFWIRHTHRPDQQYTNGVKVTMESDGGSWWGPVLARGVPDCAVAPPGGGYCRGTSITLGQELYTPDQKRAPHRVTDWELERPYFAWLYLSGSAILASPKTLRTYRLAVGVTGPPAGGELAQTIAHRLGYNDPPLGWETQIGFEPGLEAALLQRMLMYAAGDGAGPGLDVSPSLEVSAGNVRMQASAGMELRVGWNLAHPWFQPAWRTRAPWEVWVSASGRIQGVARDMSLDGNLVAPSRNVERVPGVAQYGFGIGLRLGAVAVGWRAATRTREYRTGPAHHAYGSMLLEFRRGG